MAQMINMTVYGPRRELGGWPYLSHELFERLGDDAAFRKENAQHLAQRYLRLSEAVARRWCSGTSETVVESDTPIYQVVDNLMKIAADNGWELLGLHDTSVFLLMPTVKRNSLSSTPREAMTWIRVS